jgi:hypothetical protein
MGGSMPYAASGTSFNARIDQPLDTRIASAGEHISATLIQPIKGSDGSVLVPEGTRIEGKIASIEHTDGPHMTLTFDTLQLKGGTAPVGVRVVSAQQSEYRAVPADAGVTSLQPGAPPTAQGTLQLSMAKGAVIQLALTRPIIQVKGLK